MEKRKARVKEALASRFREIVVKRKAEMDKGRHGVSEGKGRRRLVRNLDERCMHPTQPGEVKVELDLVLAIGLNMVCIVD